MGNIIIILEHSEFKYLIMVSVVLLCFYIISKCSSFQLLDSFEHFMWSRPLYGELLWVSSGKMFISLSLFLALSCFAFFIFSNTMNVSSHSLLISDCKFSDSLRIWNILLCILSNFALAVLKILSEGLCNWLILCLLCQHTILA